MVNIRGMEKHHNTRPMLIHNRDSPNPRPNKKRGTNTPSVSASASASASASTSMEDSVVPLGSLEYLRNQISALQNISFDDPSYAIGYQYVIDHLKKRPQVRSTYDAEHSRIYWDIYIDEDIRYRYEFVKIENELAMRCLFFTYNRYVELMIIRLTKGNIVPILQVHNLGYIPLSLEGAQFSHHFYALEYFIRFLYSIESIARRRRMVTQSNNELLHLLPSNPMMLPINVTINVPSPTFATETQEVNIGTLQDVLFGNPKLPNRGGTQRKRKSKKQPKRRS